MPNAAYHRDWKAKHRDRINARRRELYAQDEGRKRRQEDMRNWRERPRLKRARVLREGMRDRAAKHGLAFDSERFCAGYICDWLETQKECECCGCVLRLVPHGGAPCNASPSIDRIDPGAGYVLGNVALLCWRCNNLKRDATAEELETIAAWMRSKQST